MDQMHLSMMQNSGQMPPGMPPGAIPANVGGAPPPGMPAPPRPQQQQPQPQQGPPAGDPVTMIVMQMSDVLGQILQATGPQDPRAAQIAEIQRQLADLGSQGATVMGATQPQAPTSPFERAFGPTRANTLNNNSDILSMLPPP